MKKYPLLLIVLSACNQKVLQSPEQVIDTIKTSKRIVPILVGDDTIVLVAQKTSLTLVRTITPAQVDTKIKDATSSLNSANAILTQKVVDLTATQTLLLSSYANQQKKYIADSVINVKMIAILTANNQSLQLQATNASGNIKLLFGYNDTLNARQKATNIKLDSAAKYVDSSQFIITGSTIKLNIPYIANKLKQ